MIIRNKISDDVERYENIILTEHKWDSDEICTAKYVMWLFFLIFGIISYIAYKCKYIIINPKNALEFFENYFLILAWNMWLYSVLCICDNKLKTVLIKNIYKLVSYSIYFMLSIFVLPILIIKAVFSIISEYFRHKKTDRYDKNNLIIVDIVLDIFVQMIPIWVILLIRWNTGIDYGHDVYASNLYVYVILGCTVSIMETIKKETLSKRVVRGRLFAMCLLLCFSSTLYCIVLVYPYFDESYIYSTKNLLEFSLAFSIAFSIIYAILEAWRRYMRGEEEI